MISFLILVLWVGLFIWLSGSVSTGLMLFGLLAFAGWFFLSGAFGSGTPAQKLWKKFTPKPRPQPGRAIDYLA